MANNIVELVADADDCAFDQRCKFGHRVEGHAVYCHNDAWVDGPRKCRRSWYTNGQTRDEDCPGFQPNDAFTGRLDTPVLTAPLCQVCGGAKLVQEDPRKETVATCDRCQGTGQEPERMELAKWEVYVLESCIGSEFTHPFDHHTAILSGEPFRLKDFPTRLLDDDLLEMRSFECDGPAMIHTVRLTRKGYAVLQQHWNLRRG
jgi:hypothetical protein